MMTDKENWQEKPGEGVSSARRDGDKWNKSDDNRGSGNSFDRPRRSFGDNSGSFNRGGQSFDKPRRSFGDNNDRPQRSFGDSNDRPRRSFGDNDRGNSFDKPRRSFGDNNDRGNSFNRPQRSYGDNDRGNSFDKPRRSYGEGDGGNSFNRPQRSFNDHGNSFDRPQRSFSDNDRGNNFDRPRRSFGDNNDRGNSFDRPRRSFGEGGADRGNSFDKPRRSYSEGDGSNSFNRPQRSFGDNNDRPRRSYGDNNDRPQRSYGDSNDRPRRSFGDNNDRPRFNNNPSLPRPERADGRPRRPRIQKPGGNFDHGTPYGSRQSAPNYAVTMDPDTPIRLNKFLANAGICSRREADEFIQAGVVRVNGEVVSELGVKVKPTDDILFHDQAVSIEHKIYILLNKPKDCVTTSDDPQERTTVMDLVKGACYERIYPVGRLDRNTTGVLLLTNDGDLASKLTHPKYEKRKIYQATLDKDITPEDIQHILDGVTLDDCDVKADNCSYVDYDKKNVVGIEIHTGQNRVVRRVFESLGYKVYKLDRVYFAGLTKKNLPRGKWRHLTEKEVSLLKMGAFV
jgi:23S rRNA pseudouridine2605 synthase